jgi:ferrous iron transport protein A
VTIKLSELQKKQRAKLINYGDISKNLRCKLMGLGLHRSCEFHIERRAPFKGPIQIIVSNTAFAVRYNDVKNLEVELIDE